MHLILYFCRFKYNLFSLFVLQISWWWSSKFDKKYTSMAERRWQLFRRHYVCCPYDVLVIQIYFFINDYLWALCRSIWLIFNFVSWFHLTTLLSSFSLTLSLSSFIHVMLLNFFVNSYRLLRAPIGLFKLYPNCRSSSINIYVLISFFEYVII